MVKFDCNPHVNLTNGQFGGAGCKVSMDHEDMRLHLSATDQTLKNRNTNGVVLGAEKKGAFTFSYDVGNHAPSFKLHQAARVAGRDIGMEYNHNVKKNMSNMALSSDIDDKNSVRVTYDTTGFQRPDLKSMAVRYTYKHNADLKIESTYDLSKDSVSADVHYRLDGDNNLKVSYDQFANTGGLEWSRSNGLKVSANANLNNPTAIPALRISHDFNVSL